MIQPNSTARIFVVIVAFAVAAGGFSQETEEPTSFAVTAVSVDNDDAAFAAIVTSFVADELESERFSVHTFKTSVETPFNLDQFLISRSERVDQDYLVAIAFRREDSEVALDFFCVDIGSGAFTYRKTKVETKQLQIDFELSRLVEATVASLPDTVVRDQSPSSDPVLVIGNGDSQTNGSMTYSSPSSWTLRPEASPLHLIVGVGSFRSVGKAEDYFRSGIMPSSTIEYGFNTLSGRAGIGFRVSACFVEAESDTTSFSGIFVPFGPALGFTSRTGNFVDVAFTLGGGVSTVSIQVEGEDGYLTKVLPYAYGGVAALLRLTDGIAIRASIEAMAFFERETPILGYLPVLAIEF